MPTARAHKAICLHKLSHTIDALAANDAGAMAHNAP